MKKFETGTYIYETYTTGRQYKVEITKIEGKKAYATIDDTKEKVFWIEMNKSTGKEYILFRGKNHDALVPSDKVQ